MSFPGAVIAGLVAMSIFFVVTRLFTMNQMGMERYLATMFSERDRSGLGLILLLVLGMILGLIYAALWSAGIGWPGYFWGPVFGIFQWLLLGLLMAGLPRVHAGIRAGRVPSPGVYMTNLLGGWAFLAGLSTNLVFGLTFAFFYQFFRTLYA